MSSTIKRVALVAVAALGLGMVTTVANAATTGTHGYIKVDTATASSTGWGTTDTATAIAGTNNYVGFSVANDGTSPLNVVVTGGTANSGSTSVTGSGTSSLVIAAISGGADVPFTVATPAVGTITVKTYGFTNGVQSSTATATLTITVNAAASGTVYASTTATVATVASAPAVYTYTNASTGTTTYYADASQANTAELYSVTVDQKDASGTSLGTSYTKAVTATVSGVGQLSINGTQSTGGYAALAAASANSAVVYLYADGRSGTSTLTVSVNGVAVKTLTVTFWGAVAKYTATVNNAYIKSSAGTNTAAISVLATDANGTPVPNASVNASSSSTATTINTPVSTASGAAAALTSTEFASFGVAKFNTTTSSTSVAGPVTFTFADNATLASATVTTTASETVSGSQIASLAWTTDASSYAPGQLITLTLTAKDSTGAFVGDGSYNVYAATPTTSTNTTWVTGPSTAITFASGVATWTVYAPATAGDFTISGKLAADAGLSAALQGTTFSTPVISINNPVSDAVDAANEATDAANAATDAANAAAEAADAATAAAQDAQAAVAALATQVATLIAGIKAQITTLTNLVVKIQKKVKA